MLREALRRCRKVGLGQLAMRGEWIMVRLKPRAGEKRENWLPPAADAFAAGSHEL